MKTITLTKPWTYHTIPLTIDYPAGTFEVMDAVHDAAVKAGVHVSEQGKEHGDGTATARPARASRKAKS